MVSQYDGVARQYTPEYSNELLEFVQEVYSEDVKRYYKKLKLEKLIDLLEHAESLFEAYRENIIKGRYEDCLLAFVIGAFYVFLIIPESVQFHSRNKSYSIYVELKKYYQEEANMSNVLLMIIRKVDSVINKELEAIESIDLSDSRKRAYSVEEPSVRVQLENLTLTGPKLSEHGRCNTLLAKWTAPKLEPNDRLKIVANSSKSTENSSVNSLLLDHASIPQLNSSGTPDFVALDSLASIPFPSENEPSSNLMSRHSSMPSNVTPMVRGNSEAAFLQSSMNALDSYHTHRKDSYHSIYMNGDDEEEMDSRGAGLLRLQQENAIKCHQLFDLLKDEMIKDTILLVDLRYRRRFGLNHLVAPNLVNIDPRWLWNKQENKPIESLKELEKIVNSPIFSDWDHYQHLIYYTDNKSFMHCNFNYELVFFQLFYRDKNSQKPKYLVGGYDQWKFFLSEHIHKEKFNIDSFLFRPYSSERKEIPVPTHVPPPPPPPPPHTSLPLLLPGTPPPIPKGYAESQPPSKPYLRKAVPTPSNNPFHSAHDIHTFKGHPIGPPNSHAHLTHEIPTIQKSPNPFVSLSITGLRNVGNTCYINSMLQCLFATTKFRNIFITSKYHDYYKPTQQPISISKWFSLLFRKMYLNGGCSVVPSGFLKACHVLRPDFRIPDDQQDTQEFLLFLLDQLHNELSDIHKVANDYPDLVLHDDNNLQVNSKEYNKWFENNLKNNGLSPIDDIFQGQMENCLCCQRCGYASYSYSTFYVLSLAIPSSTSTRNHSKRNKVIKLEDCINLFTQEELLSGDNAWDCPRCGSQSLNREGDEDLSNKKKKKQFLGVNGDSKARSKFFILPRSKPRGRSVSPSRLNPTTQDALKFKAKKMTTMKSLNFITMPKVLVIHLSRFFYDLTKKNATMISYPLILDIVLKNNTIARYKLYGIVNHFGNLISGHYTSLVNKDLNHEIRGGQQKWYYFDDEVVKKEINHGDYDKGITSISSSDVYVLFYERI